MTFVLGNRGRLAEQKSPPLELKSSLTFPRARNHLHDEQRLRILHCWGVLVIGVRVVTDEKMTVGLRVSVSDLAAEEDMYCGGGTVPGG